MFWWRIDPTSGKFNVSLVQDIVPDDEWVDEHTQVPESEAQNIRKTYQAGMRMVTPLKTRDFGRIAAQTAKHVIPPGHPRGRAQPAAQRDPVQGT